MADGEAVAPLRELEAAGWAPDVLVSNAGNQNRKPVVEMTPAEWQALQNVHVNGAFNCARAALPGMVRRGFGRIVLMSSVAGQATMPNIALRHGQGAIAAFARALAVEYGGSGITCNALAPGFVRTDFTQGLQDNPQFQSFLSTAVPAGRWAEPDDIAPAVYLAARPSSTARCWRSTAACWRACRGGRHERTKRAVRPGLVKRFGGFRAVDGVSLALREGSIHALIGPNGAGKTTCFNLLTKFLSPDEGEIRYRGRDITSLAPEQIARLGIVRSFQISAVFLGLTVLQNMRVALMRQHGDGMRFWRSRRSVDRFNARALELLAAVGLDDQADTIAALLPYGRKRALEIAMTLALDPEIMLLDEPMAGLGQEDVARIAALIRRVSAKRSILMVEHNLSVVADLSDTITVLARGAVLAQGDYAAVSRDERVITAYMGAQEEAH